MLNATESVISFNKDNMHKKRSKFPSVLLQNKLFFNNVKNNRNRLIFTDSDQTIGNKDLATYEYYSVGYDNSNFARIDIVVEERDPKIGVIANFAHSTIEIHSVYPWTIRNIDGVIEEGAGSCRETTRAHPTERAVCIDDSG